MGFHRGMKTIRSCSLLLAALLLLLLTANLGGAKSATSKKEYLVYVGTYTQGESKGIYVFRFDPAKGRLTPLGLAAATANASFLAVDPSQHFLYATNEIEDYQGRKSGGISAFTIDRETGKLTFLNEVPSGGTDPCHLVVDKTGKYVLVANYGNGSVAVLPIMAGGRLGEASTVIQHTGSGVNPERQKGPHAHSMNLSPDNHFAFAADLGLDKLFVYSFDSASGALASYNPPFAKVNPGAGPRHFVFHPSGDYAYVINELQSTITAFSYEPAFGVLHEMQTISTLPKGFMGANTDAELEMHPSGKFLYGSNRGHNTIAVFAIDVRTGELRLIADTPTRGTTPRSFEIDPTGAYLIAANADSNTLVPFRIDSKTGRLTPTGQVLETPIPVCVKFVAVE